MNRNIQARAVAEIALSLPDKPTGVDLLVALNKLYEMARDDTIALLAVAEAEAA